MDIIIKKYSDFTNKMISEVEFNIDEEKKIKNLIQNESKIYEIIKKAIIVEIYKKYTTYGYLYCMHNDMYNYYGKNVYKLGCAKNIKIRENGYTTSYLEKSDMIIKSKNLLFYEDGEKILFNLLSKCRIKNSREFFDCNLNIIKENIENVEKLLNNEKIEDLVVKYDTMKSSDKNDLRHFFTIIGVNHLFSEINPFKKTKVKCISKEIDIRNLLLKNEIDIRNDYNRSKNLIYKKILTIFWLEKIFKISRYDVQNIILNDISDLKKELSVKFEDIILLFDGVESKTKLTKRITNKINKINYYDQMQKFMADCYNSFGNIIEYQSKFIQETTNNKRIMSHMTPILSDI